MPQQNVVAVENNFTKGLVTEFTGLNFPENAATEADNCAFTLIGNITRREGVDFEPNAVFNPINRTNNAVASYKWNNAGGDGLTQVVVEHVGGTLYFYKSSAVSGTSPVSAQLLASTVNVSQFVAAGATFDPTKECQFTDGNGYLFVYQSTCDPFYCTYTNGVITATMISVQIRDFTGVVDNTLPNQRPSGLTIEHLYNLQNQGWTQGNPWSALAPNGVVVQTGNVTFTVPSGISGIVVGQGVSIYNLVTFLPGGFPPVPVNTVIMAGNVFSYSGTSLIITVNYTLASMTGNTAFSLNIVPTNVGYINTWFADLANYPSNADVWWYFKDNTDVFNPTATVTNVTLSSSNAPQGHYIFNAFNQNKAVTSSITGLTTVSTLVRPRTGTWFQGRVWYTGVDAQQPATGDAAYYTWTESIYFSQIVQTPADFGSCYQQNDPTSENLFDLLPTDGGVIQIQGCGSIFKLFPIQNGMLVFAANGVWFITGSQGIGFSANDYTITKLSNVRSISSHSFVNVQGLPYFWNQEGIYAVEPQQGGGLAVNPLTVGTILTFFSEIPYDSIKYARGDYDPINYIVQWVYRSTEETSVTDRYTYDSILNLNTYNKAFYPYTIDTSVNSINSILYVSSPGGQNAFEASLMYFSGNLSKMSFALEYDDTFVDWGSINYVSSFTTGYRIKGQAQRRLQMPYIVTFSRGGDTGTSFYIQAIWDYATTGNSGKWSTRQQVNSFDPNFSVIARRHRLRGQGLSLQLKFTSVDGQLFDLMGWSSDELVNTGL